MTKRKTKRELRQLGWLRGRLDWKLREPQLRIEKKFQEVQSRGQSFLFVNCSRRIGKTVWAAKKAIETARRCPLKAPRIKIGSAYYEDLKEFIIPSHDLILEDCPRPILPKYLQSSKKYVFKDKNAEIKLVGLDLKPNGLRGNYGDLILLEECGFMRNLDYLYSSVCMPMTMYRGGAMVVMIGTPPSTPDHPFVTFMEKAKLEDAYIELTIDDNTELTQEEKDKYLAECLTDTDRLREYYCKVVVDASRAIVPEWKEEYEAPWPRDEYFPHYHKYDGMDLGVVDQTVCLFSWYDYRNATVVFEDEFVMSGPEMTTDKLAAGIRNKEGEVFAGHEITTRISDNDNLLLLNDLAYLHGLPFGEVKKSTLESMVNNFRIMVKEGRVRVHPRCKQLRGCLRTGIWDERRKEFARSKVYGHYDALAAAIYTVWSLDTHTNPVPRMHGLSHQTHIIPAGWDEPQEVSELKKAFGINR